MKNNLKELLKKNPCFDYEGASKVGYTDQEIIEFLLNPPSEEELPGNFEPLEIEASSEYIEISFGQKIESLVNNHPIPFYTSLTLIFLALCTIFIRYTWIILKFVIYHVVFTITKAIKDGKS